MGFLTQDQSRDQIPKMALGTGRMKALAFSWSSAPPSLQRRNAVMLSAQSSPIFPGSHQEIDREGSLFLIPRSPASARQPACSQAAPPESLMRSVATLQSHLSLAEC